MMKKTTLQYLSHRRDSAIYWAVEVTHRLKVNKWHPKWMDCLWGEVFLVYEPHGGNSPPCGVFKKSSEHTVIRYPKPHIRDTQGPSLTEQVAVVGRWSPRIFGRLWRRLLFFTLLLIAQGAACVSFHLFLRLFPMTSSKLLPDSHVTSSMFELPPVKISALGCKYSHWKTYIS